MRVLVIGATGFIARHLVARLRDDGAQVTGTSRSGLGMPGVAMRALAPDAGPDRIRSLIDDVRPAAIYHLPGLTTASSLAALFAVNAAFAGDVLAAARRAAVPPVCILAGSAAEYGPVPPEVQPVGEDVPCRPVTPYGITKLAQTHLGLCAAAEGLPVIIARLFNVVGPGMADHLAFGRFVRRLAALEAAGGGVLETGSLGARRDILAVTDAAAMLAALATRPAACGRVVNVCSGESVTIRHVLGRLIAATGLDIRLVEQPVERGTSALPALIGSPAVLRALGIAPPATRLDDALSALWQSARTGPATDHAR